MTCLRYSAAVLTLQVRSHYHLVLHFSGLEDVLISFQIIWPEQLDLYLDNIHLNMFSFEKQKQK